MRKGNKLFYILPMLLCNNGWNWFLFNQTRKRSKFLLVRIFLYDKSYIFYNIQLMWRPWQYLECHVRVIKRNLLRCCKMHQLTLPQHCSDCLQCPWLALFSSCFLPSIRISREKTPATAMTVQLYNPVLFSQTDCQSQWDFLIRRFQHILSKPSSWLRKY